MKAAHWWKIVWGVGLALYAASLLWLSVGTPGTFISPDENVAFAFAQAWREQGNFAVAEPLNEALGGIVHPRSAVAIGTLLAPGSFLGMPLVVGTIGRLVGGAGMLWVTPFLAVVAILAWRRVVLNLFGDARLATLAAIALAVFPPFWYYAARSMMHNVAFVAFLIFGAWFVIAKPFSTVGKQTSRRLVEFILGGVCVGIAMMLRTVEVVWIGVGLIALVAAVRRFRATEVLAFAGGVAMMLALFALLQASVYGSAFTNGYLARNVQTPDSSIQMPDDTSQTSEPGSPSGVLSLESSLSSAAHLLLPFGVHPRAMLKNVWHFGLTLFPWMTILAAVGVGVIGRNVIFARVKDSPHRRAWVVLFVALLVLAVWLGVLYGSWSFNDNPDPKAVTLADSHTRYWLPLFVLATPFIAYALQWLTSRKPQMVWPVVAIMVALSWSLVFLGHDGLIASRQELFASAAKRDAIVAVTEADAVVVVDRADKFLWPVRSVIVPLRDESTYAAMPSIVALVPLYYFGIPFPDADMTYLNDIKLAGLGLRIDFVTAVDDEALYRITSVE